MLPFAQSGIQCMEFFEPYPHTEPVEREMVKVDQKTVSVFIKRQQDGLRMFSCVGGKGKGRQVVNFPAD